ncbi:DEAD-box ATP-dependent RNA helicase 31-like [Zingiber officinale]|uniref:DEAD-box ATP-dependent RNA helicase 31-like n=1 Tax=Zingiber officinale TaxID=94328 RepID=UPI001C4D9EBB|nr:DEAD-box ATP-dependent RNA helicase 31-like [Zingiber officinale]
MIGRLIPFRLFRSSGSLRLSRYGVASAAAHPSSVFSTHPEEYPLGSKFFTTRSSRSGLGPGTRENRRGDFKSRGAAGQAKSLIDDEAELSDWVSDLRKDSFRLRMKSDDDEESDEEMHKSYKGRGRGRDSDEFSSRGRRSMMDRSPSRNDGGRGRDSDEFSSRGRRPMMDRPPSRNDRGRGRDSNEFSSRGRRPMMDRSPSRNDDFSRESSSGKFRSFEGGRGGSLRSMKDKPLSRMQRDDDFDDFSGSSGKFKSRASRNSPVKRRFDSDLEDEDDDSDDDDEFGSSSRKSKGRGGKKMPSTFSRKDKRDNDLSFKQMRGVDRSAVSESDEEVSESEGEEDEETEHEDDVSGFSDDFFGNKDEKEGSVNDLLTSLGSTKLGNEDNAHSAPKKSDSSSDSYLSETRFDECSISPLTLKGVKAAGYEKMTLVQAATLPVILQGKDVLAKAKTGTGKTVAFLLPAIEVVSKLPPVDRDQRRPPINVLVICPTRELADQAAAEADKLLKFHPSICVQVVMGGTRLALEQKKMQTNPCQILVATPGRLRDHIENTPGFATQLMGVKVLILDEADRLLDMGFRKDIEKIVTAVPKQRQTLLFSATVPDEVRQICYIAMRRDLEFINTVEEGTEETHSHVRQMQLVAPLEKHFSTLYSVLTEHISENADYKVIVFCTTAMVTRLVADLLSELKLNVREIHSRKPQTYRTRVSKEFRESKGLILVSSDVSARGVDYPNVTFVIQLGIPADREQYIHRLGRTGRKGQEGVGILMLAPWEDFFLSSIKDLPITKAEAPTIDLDTRKKVERALAHVDLKHKESAYQAWLGYYNSNKKIGRDKSQLVSLANEFSRSMGLDNPPSIAKNILSKMGLNNVPGLRVR